MSSTPESIREKVRAGYTAIAQRGVWLGESTQTASSGGCCTPSKGKGGGCCGPATLSEGELARQIGYSQAELACAPEGANMGLSCGNPAAIAALRPGETVLDLGAGGGFDCFIAGPKVGASGRVIGVDMTAEMLTRARAGVEPYRRLTGLSNVEFRLGEIENLPVADSTVDVVLSNCVLNLSPDKPRVWREIARVLRPGGRVAISDLALLRPLPEAVREMMEALIGCVSGAVLVSEIDAMIRAAGLDRITLTPKPEYIRSMTDWQDPLYRRIVDALPPGATAADFITSLDISAYRPA